MPARGQAESGYSEEYRRAVVRRIDPRSRTAGIAAAARAEHLPEHTVRRWYSAWASTGQLTARPHSGGNPPLLTWAETQALYNWLDADNTLSNSQLAARLRRVRVYHKRVSPQRISEYLSGADPPFVRLTASRVDPDVLTDVTIAQRVRFSRRRARIPLSRQVYLDEKFFYLRRPATRVRGRRGSRQYLVAPYRSHRVLFFCALTQRGWFAPKLIDASLNDRTFRTWAAEDFVPQLRRDDVVYLDQLGKGSAHVASAMHYNPTFVRSVRGRRAQLEYTPRKTPQANPTELLFNYLEEAVRRRASSSFDDLWRVIRRRLVSITPEMTSGWLSHRATDRDMIAQERTLGIDRREFLL